LETHESAEESADERDETTEDRDGASDDVGGYSHAGGAAEPYTPVDETVAGEMSGASEQADEDVLGRQLQGMLVSGNIRYNSRERSQWTYVKHDGCSDQ